MELTQAPLPFEGEAPSHPLSEVKNFVIQGITAGIQHTSYDQGMERELAEGLFANIMDALGLTEPNPFSTPHYDVTVSIGYDTLFTLTDYEFDGDEEALEQHIAENLDITVEAKYEISFERNRGVYEDDGSILCGYPDGRVLEDLTFEITLRD